LHLLRGRIVSRTDILRGHVPVSMHAPLSVHVPVSMHAPLSVHEAVSVPVSVHVSVSVHVPIFGPNVLNCLSRICDAPAPRACMFGMVSMHLHVIHKHSV
jgi:hypothetical protein